jgi:predicted phosphate transport protein (TIGR00153 family)
LPFQVIPRELAFFDLFERAADGVEKSTAELLVLLDDLPNAARHAERIADLEQAGDETTHEILALLHTTFVVPIDRHDIVHLASTLDDILDAVDAVADLLSLHGILEPIPQFRQQVDVLARATHAVGEAVRDLRSYHRIERRVAEIKRQEREGDWVYRRAVATLYSGDYKAMDVLRWKDLLSQTEEAIDRCEDIANTLESVALKHA